MKLEVGKYYRTRDGRKVGPMRERLIYSGSFWSDVGGAYHDDGSHVATPQNDIIAEWTDTPEVGTLKEIGAQVGDVVSCTNTVHQGTEFEVTEGFEDWCGCNKRWWRIISRAQPSPVRTVTTRVIVPGAYGAVSIITDDDGDKVIDLRYGLRTADELTAAIQTLTAIRDAMQANTTA